ncbi:MAG: DUF1292 domain-containing protein [Eubacterium sp.]|nr:DUF1292 domain-containing protein [Eubacterium sp.]
MENIIFTDPDTNESASFFVLAQTTVNEQTFFLVTEDEEGDSDAWIMRQLSSSDSEELDLEFVEDDETLESLSKIFKEMLDDTEVIF